MRVTYILCVQAIVEYYFLFGKGKIEFYTKKKQWLVATVNTHMAFILAHRSSYTILKYQIYQINQD